MNDDPARIAMRQAFVGLYVSDLPTAEKGGRLNFLEDATVEGVVVRGNHLAYNRNTVMRLSRSMGGRADLRAMITAAVKAI